ncbi:hypothetical protein Pint_06959 [Pistacia integerrima]|uniref:Uncharacterized protein n=1 Tax=Pistacia integerrima TaxID=434235 RepID=A0ACC0XVF6_9ROSI|nr:hypothetical protein Pint_06959 [Pistacia integerrima]
MADVVANQVGGSFGDANDAQRNVFDLGAFVGDLTLEEDASAEILEIARNLRGSPLEAFAGDQSVMESAFNCKGRVVNCKLSCTFVQTTRYFIVKMLIAVAVFGSDDTSLEGLERSLKNVKTMMTAG